MAWLIDHKSLIYYFTLKDIVPAVIKFADPVTAQAMVNFMCQPDQAMRCPDIILSVSIRVFWVEINI